MKSALQLIDNLNGAPRLDSTQARRLRDEVLHEIFLSAGYTCQVAGDGREGLELFRATLPPLTVTDLKIMPWHRQVLRSLGTWRYDMGVFGFPVELRAMFKYISYRRPELEGL